MIFKFSFNIFILVFLLKLKLIKTNIDVNENSRTSHPGHGRPFGSSGPFLQMDQIDDSELNTKLFFDKYVKEKRPILIKNMVKDFPAFHLWTDEYLRGVSSSFDNYKIVVETEKKESRDQQIISMPLREFLLNYKTKGIYMVNEVPFYLRKDVVLPQALQCDQAPKTLEETVIINKFKVVKYGIF